MPRRLAEGEERKIGLNFSVDPSVLKAIDENVKNLKKWLKTEYNADKKVLNEFSRSSFIRECLALMAQPEYFEILKNTIVIGMGLKSSQIDWIKEQQKQK